LAKSDGGLGLGTAGTSIVFLAAVLATVAYLTISRRDVIDHDEQTRRPRTQSLAKSTAQPTSRCTYERASPTSHGLSADLPEIVDPGAAVAELTEG
jgi:hypothetical protein